MPIGYRRFIVERRAQGHSRHVATHARVLMCFVFDSFQQPTRPRGILARMRVIPCWGSFRVGSPGVADGFALSLIHI